MPRVFRFSVLTVLVAWSALLLPWQRCTAECHDKLVVVVAAKHECCHAGCKPPAAPQAPDQQHDGDHQELGFSSLAPTVAPLVHASDPADAFASIDLPRPAAIAAAIDAPERFAPPGLRGTVVMLL